MPTSGSVAQAANAAGRHVVPGDLPSQLESLSTVPNLHPYPIGRHAATAGARAHASSAGEEEKHGLEAFDQGEFYAQLLKEFL